MARATAVSEAEAKSEAIMHLDGCHFFVWVIEHNGKQRLQWNERIE